MVACVKIAPPNSVILVSDPSSGQIPESMRGSLIAETDSCIAIGCRAEDDGETEISLGQAKDLEIGSRPTFEGSINTPSQKIAVCTVLGATLLEMSVPTLHTAIRVWANDPQEPDCIAIGIVEKRTD